MTCGRCGAPVTRAGVRFCTACGAPLAPDPGGPQAGRQPQPPAGPTGPYGAPQPPAAGYPPYGQPPPDYPPPTPPRRSSSLGPIIGGAVVILLLLAGVSYWALSQMDNPPISVGRPSTPTPTPTPPPTATPVPGLGITVPGPQGTPTVLTVPIPGISATVQVPSLPIPGLDGSPALPTITLPTITIPGASGTQPPGAKLTADQAREKVEQSVASCRLLQAQIELSQVTFEPPTWVVRLPLTGASWRVDDTTGAVTPDEHAAERVKNCRL